MTSSIFTLLATALLAANPPAEPPLVTHLPAGIQAPKVGARCFDSEAALGTSNVQGSGAASTVVNIWAIERPSDSSIVGFVIKAFDGSYWYESPVPGFDYERVDAPRASILILGRLKMVGCFRSDLPAQ